MTRYEVDANAHAIAVEDGPIEQALAAFEATLGPAPEAGAALLVDATARPASGWERQRFTHRAAALGWRVVGWVLTDATVDALAAAHLGIAVLRGEAPEATGDRIDLPGVDALAAALADAD